MPDDGQCCSTNDGEGAVHAPLEPLTAASGAALSAIRCAAKGPVRGLTAEQSILTGERQRSPARR